MQELSGISPFTIRWQSLYENASYHYCSPILPNWDLLALWKADRPTQESFAKKSSTENELSNVLLVKDQLWYFLFIFFATFHHAFFFLASIPSLHPPPLAVAKLSDTVSSTTATEMKNAFAGLSIYCPPQRLSMARCCDRYERYRQVCNRLCQWYSTRVFRAPSFEVRASQLLPTFARPNAGFVHLVD